MSGHIHCEFHQTGLPNPTPTTAVHLLGKNTLQRCFNKTVIADGFSRIFSAPPSSPVRDDLIYRRSYHEEEALIVLVYIQHGEEQGKIDVYTASESRIPYGYKVSFSCPKSELLEIQDSAFQLVGLSTSRPLDLQSESHAEIERDTNFAFRKIHKLVEAACKAKMTPKRRRAFHSLTEFSTPRGHEGQAGPLSRNDHNATEDNSGADSPLPKVCITTPVTPKSKFDLKGPKRCHDSITPPKPIPIDWDVRPVVGLATLCQNDHERALQETKSESQSEANSTDISSQITEPESTFSKHEVKLISKKRKLPMSFYNNSGDRKRLCVDLNIFIRNPHIPDENFRSEENEVLSRSDESEKIEKDLSDDTVVPNSTPQKTGPSWQDLRRLPCGRVCFDPEFYGC